MAGFVHEGRLARDVYGSVGARVEDHIHPVVEVELAPFDDIAHAARVADDVVFEIAHRLAAPHAIREPAKLERLRLKTERSVVANDDVPLKMDGAVPADIA